MKHLIITASFMFFFNIINAQTVDIDLSEKKGLSYEIDLDTRSIRLVNMSKNFTYILDWKKKNVSVKPFDISALAASDPTLGACSQDVKDIIADLDNEKDEAEVKKVVVTGRSLLSKLTGPCAAILAKSIGETERVIEIPFKLNYNQIITLKVRKIDRSEKQDSSWTYTLKTEENSRWLVHYGLTYAPSIFSKVDQFHTFADTSLANRYTIRKDSDDGPKPWDNISATINFTYPFQIGPKDYDGGFTAGFGISAGFELSGQAGLSFIIGENVILSSGVAIIQRSKLQGQYQENQIIKENLQFDALHEKVWLPEMYFTLGFRFGSNPFAKSTETTDKKPDKK